MAEVNGIEAIRNNQKIFELPTKFSPSSLAAHEGIVIVGGEVCQLGYVNFSSVDVSSLGHESETL